MNAYPDSNAIETLFRLEVSFTQTKIIKGIKRQIKLMESMTKKEDENTKEIKEK